MILRKELSWEYDVDAIDMDKNIQTIVPRVLERGTYHGWKEILRYYGKEKIIETLLNTRYLNDKALHFAAFIFDLPLEKFRCFTEKQLNRQH